MADAENGAVEDTERGSPFFAAVREHVRPRDCALLAVVPAVLVGVFSLPVEVRRSLVFSYVDPTAPTAYTATVVHLRAGHLLANATAYLLLAGVGYLLAALSGHRRLFATAAATYLVAFPPALAALNLAVPRDAFTYGFSGIVAAFAGLLPVLLITYTERRLDGNVRVRYAPALFFAVLGVVALVALPTTTVTLAVAVVSLSLAAVYVRLLVRSRWDPRRFLDAVASSPGWGDLFLVGMVLSLGYPFVGFRTAGDGVVVNRYVHLLGYCLAFLVPYVGLELGAFEDDRDGDADEPAVRDSDEPTGADVDD